MSEHQDCGVEHRGWCRDAIHAQVARLRTERDAMVGLYVKAADAIDLEAAYYDDDGSLARDVTELQRQFSTPLSESLAAEVERQRLQREENETLRGLLREWLAVPCQCDMSDAEHEIHGCESSEIEGKTREALGDEA